MKKINAAFSTSWADNELALLEATEAAFDQGHTNNWLADKINKSTEAEKERTKAIAASTAATISAGQKLMMEGNRLLGRHGVTNAYFDSSGSLQMLSPNVSKHTRDWADVGGWTTSFGDGEKSGSVTNTELEKLGYITVNVNTGIWEKDEQALGRAIAEAINTAADGSGAILKPKAVAAQ